MLELKLAVTGARVGHGLLQRRRAEREAWGKVAKPFLRLATFHSSGCVTIHHIPAPLQFWTRAVPVISGDALTGTERRAEPGVCPEQW